MTDGRDWIKTLWPASYKGFPFFLDSDEEEGGLDQVIHKFCNNDNPFIEDMGEGPRYFTGAAYIHGDDADTQASAFIKTLVSHGAGVLVLPIVGPVIVRAMPFKRRHEKDKLGYVAIEVKFVREGAASALVSLPSLLNLAYGAADQLAAAAASVSEQLDLAGRPDYVVAAATDTLASGAAALDALRITENVSPDASATVRDALAGIIGDTAVVATSADAAPIISDMVAAARTLADAMPAASAARAMLDLLDTFPPTPAGVVYQSAGARLAAQNADAAARIVRLAGLVGFAEAVMRATYSARPDGINARAQIAVRFEAELEVSDGAENAAIYIAIQGLRAAVIEWLSRVINNLAPIITVETKRRWPSLVAAWRLYADPLRGAEIVARNNVRDPSFLPQAFSALSN